MMLFVSKKDIIEFKETLINNSKNISLILKTQSNLNSELDETQSKVLVKLLNNVQKITSIVGFETNNHIMDNVKSNFSYNKDIDVDLLFSPSSYDNFKENLTPLIDNFKIWI